MALSMMISDRTYQACKDHIDVRELDTIRVVGKKEAVTVYELLDKKNETPSILSELVVRFNDALAKYKDKDFLAAKELFDNCLNIIASDCLVKFTPNVVLFTLSGRLP